MNPLWTDEEIVALKKYWLEGRSAAEIACLFPGRTRSAVIGRVHRLGLPGRANPTLPSAGKALGAPKAPKGRPTPKTQPPKPGQQGKVAVVLGVTFATLPPEEADKRRAHAAELGRAAERRIQAQEIASPDAKPFLEARSGCKWPIGEGLAMRFCCNPVRGGEGVGKNHCEGHYWIAIDKKQPAAPRRDNAGSLARYDRIATPRPKAANDDPFSSLWDDGRAAA